MANAAALKRLIEESVHVADPHSVPPEPSGPYHEEAPSNERIIALLEQQNALLTLILKELRIDKSTAG